MEKMIGRCGFVCSQCLAFKDNIKSEEDRRRFSDGALKYYGFYLPPEECYCDGCLAPDENGPRLIDIDCKIRPCVMKKGIENCSYCQAYPCNELEEKSVDYKVVAEKYGAAIPEEDYKLFIRPYENKKYFNSLRKKNRNK